MMHACEQYKQKGAGLIEVLVAVLILAIGLLGLGGLQTQSMKQNRESYYRTQLTLIAADMVDRMRANRTIALTSDNYKFALTDTPPASANKCETSECSGAELALHDFKQWRDQIETALPGGRGSVEPSASLQADGTRPYTYIIKYNLRFGQASAVADEITFEYRTRI